MVIDGPEQAKARGKSRLTTCARYWRGSTTTGRLESWGGVHIQLSVELSEAHTASAASASFCALAPRCRNGPLFHPCVPLLAARLCFNSSSPGALGMPTPQSPAQARRQAQQQSGVVSELMGVAIGTYTPEHEGTGVGTDHLLLLCPLQARFRGLLTLSRPRRTRRRVRGMCGSSVCLPPPLPTAAARSANNAAPFLLPAAALEATLTNLRTKLTDVESDKCAWWLGG